MDVVLIFGRLEPVDFVNLCGAFGSFESAAVMIGELMQCKATASCSWHLEWAEKRAVG